MDANLPASPATKIRASIPLQPSPTLDQAIPFAREISRSAVRILAHNSPVGVRRRTIATSGVTEYTLSLEFSIGSSRTVSPACHDLGRLRSGLIRLVPRLDFTGYSIEYRPTPFAENIRFRQNAPSLGQSSEPFDET